MLLEATIRFLRAGTLVATTAGALLAGVLLGAGLGPPPAASFEPANAAAPKQAAGEPAPWRVGQPAKVMRVIDGDTFEARVNVWPGLEVTTKVRLRGVDAPETRARCAGEIARAETAREALSGLLAEGSVGLAEVTLDKYGGRVIADVSTRRTPDIAAALLRAGVVRSSAGGRRQPWC